KTAVPSLLQRTWPPSPAKTVCQVLLGALAGYPDQRAVPLSWLPARNTAAAFALAATELMRMRVESRVQVDPGARPRAAIRYGIELPYTALIAVVERAADGREGVLVVCVRRITSVIRSDILDRLTPFSSLAQCGRRSWRHEDSGTRP